MNINFVTPISLSLASATLFGESSDGSSTTAIIEFMFLGQPVRLVVDKATNPYDYNTTIAIGSRVKLTKMYSSFGINSEGILQDIIFDASTQDMADVLFDVIYPAQILNADISSVSNTGQVSVLFRVPFSYLENV